MLTAPAWPGTGSSTSPEPVRIKLDENLGRSVVALFEAAGHDVTTIYGQSMAGAKDPSVYATCRGEGRVLVTLDMDFANPFRYDPADTAGIAVLRIPDESGLDDLHRVASTLIVRLGEADIAGHLWIANHRGVRQYEPGDR